MEEIILQLKPGETLFKEGEATKDLYIIQSGVVRVYSGNITSKIWPLAIIHAGGFVGEMSFFDGKPRSATAEAVTDVQVLKLEASRLEKDVKQLPSWVLVMIRSLADRVRDINNLVKRNQLNDPTLDEEFKKWSSSL